MIETMTQRSITAAARLLCARRLDARIEGIEHLPRRGPVLIAARHVHHLYDGCVLLSAVPRATHLLVALDWAADRRTRLLMERACAMARWPIVLRAERLQSGTSVYRPEEAGSYLRRAVRDSVALLRGGGALVVFPEAYPAIDPVPGPRTSEDDFLPFRPGFIGLADLAQRDGHTRVPIIPAGLDYRPGPRWQVTLRFGAPLFVAGRVVRASVARRIEEQVRALSAAPRVQERRITEEVGVG